MPEPLAPTKSRARYKCLGLKFMSLKVLNALQTPDLIHIFTDLNVNKLFLVQTRQEVHLIFL